MSTRPGQHTCIAYNDGRGTIRVRRTKDKSNERHVLFYSTTPIDTFYRPPIEWPLPDAQFVLRDHEIAAFKGAL